MAPAKQGAGGRKKRQALNCPAFLFYAAILYLQ